jgi:hypothetical protein
MSSGSSGEDSQEETMSTNRPTVLFVCLHGSAKSLIAAEYFNRLAAARGIGARATSAGTEPDDTIPPHVTRGLGDDGIDVAGRRPRHPAPADVEGWPPSSPSAAIWAHWRRARRASSVGTTCRR